MKKPEELPYPEEAGGVEEYRNPETVRESLKKQRRARQKIGELKLERALKAMDDPELNVQMPEGDIDDPNLLTEDQRKATEKLNEIIDTPKKKSESDSSI